MSAPGDFDSLSGTAVTLDSVSPPQVWVLDEKLTEEYRKMSQGKVDRGGGPPFAAVKFTCHRASDPDQKGFMRLYIQIPVTGTLLAPAAVRAQQAVPQRTHGELEVLQNLADQQCEAVPPLLGTCQRQQGDEECVPGGYVNCVAWARVAGEPIDEPSFFTKHDRQYRDEVRRVFRQTYLKLAKCGWQPMLLELKKIIYDEDTQEIIISLCKHIAGFRDFDPLDPSQQFTDVIYASWGLANISPGPDWAQHSSDWEW
ncbi:hypothetical protein ASPZODRAFT_18668 [Penicilliopsis zonata CBS 506.65]|uniref:Uncharacterized protein n=1 Tax=Penicilliopsis zonata CBS 506.65 TaxID=1073090 RepID=A0A1L9SBF3_9EURO|nr:hypothetical protein ASPZODRAFT_18668 [Penicilliopsis zonata CBS 506.65]OJJ44478.1 hypothetical protein ASPZODRAFT_18668 [Penicilliopsis zonata CBS 506.65]